MTLDDFDWKHGEVLVRGKDQREARLPLPKDVGAALVGYLRYARPECSTRRVFIRTRAPRRSLNAASIGDVVHRALRRAGLNPGLKGSHLLRHSLATNLQRRGATLTEIGQLLRHTDLTTTQIYAKVDIGALRTVAARCAMSKLSIALDEYLKVRRALGYKLNYMRKGAYCSSSLSLPIAPAQVSLPPSSHCNGQCSLPKPSQFGGRGDWAWSRHCSAADPRTVVPPPDLLPYQYRRPAPYIYRDEQITQLLQAAQRLPSRMGLRPHTYTTLLGLYVATGLRCNEALQLDRDDVDLTDGVITVRNTKFGKSRYVPLHPTAKLALQRYAARRDRVYRKSVSPSFFLSERGTRPSQAAVEDRPSHPRSPTECRVPENAE
jgi:integrase/recombinase XerD